MHCRQRSTLPSIDQHRGDGEDRKTDGDPALRQEIFAVMESGNLGGVVRRPEHDVGKQQQFERHQKG
jgi:hypothetical protein